MITATEVPPMSASATMAAPGVVQAGDCVIRHLRSSAEPGPTVLALGRRAVGLLLQEHAMRMVAVFTTSTFVIALRTRVASRRIGRLGVVVNVVLLVSVGTAPWVELVFPAWVLLPGPDILRSGLAGQSEDSFRSRVRSRSAR